MSSQRQGATRTVEESLRKRNGASREAERGFHSLTRASLFWRRRPCGASSCALGNDPRRGGALDRLFGASLRTGARGRRDHPTHVERALAAEVITHPRRIGDPRLTCLLDQRGPHTARQPRRATFNYLARL
jgi:hypothetical protein